jgi:hypothetical protein
LKPLDIVVGLKAHLWSGSLAWSFDRLAASLGIAASQAHTSLRRLETARLYRPASRSLRTHAFGLFAEHGIPHVFPAEVGERTVGMPTAHAAPPLCDLLVSGEAYVWPSKDGIEGRGVIPLHPEVPGAAAADDALYRALALIDALRVGRVRDRRLASEELPRLLAEPGRDAAWVGLRRMKAG